MLHITNWKKEYKNLVDYITILRNHSKQMAENKDSNIPMDFKEDFWVMYYTLDQVLKYTENN